MAVGPGRAAIAFEAGACMSADELVDRIVSGVAALLGDDAPLLDAADVARQLGRSRGWVYRHADELGAVRLGEGERPRLGFDRAKVAVYRSASSAGRRSGDAASPAAEPTGRRRRRQPNGQGDGYLPIRGEAPPC